MDGSEFGITCPCGYENFERVVVERVPGRPITTDFVACVGCRAMFHAPLAKRTPARERRPEPPPRPRPREYAFPHLQSNMPRGYVDPALDSNERLKEDSAVASKDYVKPGRHKPPRR